MRSTYGHTLIDRQRTIAYNTSPYNDTETVYEAESWGQSRFVVKVDVVKHSV